MDTFLVDTPTLKGYLKHESISLSWSTRKVWKKEKWYLDKNVIYCTEKHSSHKLDEFFVSDLKKVQYIGDYEKQKYVFLIETSDGPCTKSFYLKGQLKEDSLMWVNALQAIVSPTDRTIGKPKGKKGKRFGHGDFEKMKIIGKGAFGTVYMVKKIPTDEIYAMKVMRKQEHSTQEEIQRVKRERDIFAKLDHPFIVKLYWSFQSKVSLFFVMYYVDGGELFNHLRYEGSFSESKTRFYAAQLALAVGYLHEQGIIYRDMKPENILIGSDGYIKITDFGLSKMGLALGETTSTFCGTPEYLAPEIILDHEYTMNVDWWTLGIIVYEMLTGLPPFIQENDVALYQSITEDPVQYPETFAPETVSLLDLLLDKDPETRPSTLKQIKQTEFFEEISWKKLQQKQITAPFKPSTQFPNNTIPELFTEVEEDVLKQTPPESDYINFTYDASIDC